MKKIILIILLALAMNANAQTYISGFINANTTWNLAGSPYIVNGNTLVSHGYTLTIDPGVVVEFDTAKALQIDGELIAIGTPTNRIRFTSNQTIHRAGFWDEIHFTDTCMSAVYDSHGNYISGSIMKYCDVLYGGGTGLPPEHGMIHIEQSSPYFSHCNIMYSFSDDIYCYSSSFIIDSSTLKNCGAGWGEGGYPICVEKMSLKSSKMMISEDTIEDNPPGSLDLFPTAGIWLLDDGPSVCSALIANNYFIHNSGEEVINIGTTYQVTIQDNYFINDSADYGIIKFDQSHYDTIQCNRFINNYSPGGCITSPSGQYTTEVIINNYFKNNTNTSSYSVAQLLCFGILNYPFVFSNNYITANSSTGGICSFYIYDLVNQKNNIHIDHNTFINNTGTIALNITANSATINPNYLFFKYNNFEDPEMRYEVFNGTPYGSPNIYADTNYWGTTSTTHIDSVIFDYFDSSNLSVVYYSPILTTPATTDTTCPPSGIITNIINPEISNTILIYPNPATKNITIEIPQNSTIEITNIEGELIETIVTTGNKATIDVSAFAKGMYFVKVKTEKGVAVKKFVKE